uniref:BOP1 ribosomal biogenesis factor n=1 Tax=Chelydra serpentina TaxID=8475 RepID=A0A8C3SFM0_CHESE
PPGVDARPALVNPSIRIKPSLATLADDSEMWGAADNEELCSRSDLGAGLWPALDGGQTEPCWGRSAGRAHLPPSVPLQDVRNTVGNIPMEWYQEYPHVGYDLDGKRIYKPIRTKDELDKFLDKMENPDYWRTVQDKLTGVDVRLTDEQVELVQRLQKGQFGDVHLNPYEPAVDFFSSQVMIHPVTNRPADKRSFIPSLLEKEKVSRLVHAIKMGWIKPRKPKEDTPTYYDLWAQEDPNSILGRHKMHVPAPKLRLPGHEESYNPPPEYLLSEEERLAWEQQEATERKLNVLPQQYRCLRAVPAHARFIHERFERCLDLYLCPRQRKMRVNVDPEDLIPKLPKPRDLQPFPTTQALVYRGHTSLVRCLSISPSGQWLVSGKRPVPRGWRPADPEPRRPLSAGVGRGAAPSSLGSSACLSQLCVYPRSGRLPAHRACPWHCSGQGPASRARGPT